MWVAREWKMAAGQPALHITALFPLSFSMFPTSLLSFSFLLSSLPLFLTVLEDVMCPPLASPVNGSVENDNQSVGAEASYSCSEGFSLSGPQTRTCQPNGAWSGDEPTCEREFASIHLDVYLDGLHIFITQQQNFNHFHPLTITCLVLLWALT